MDSEVLLIERVESAAPDEIVAALPGRVRDIATLRGLGYTCLEIGRRMDISAQAVSATLARYRRRAGDFGGRREMLELSTRAVNALSRIGIDRRADVRGRDIFALLARQKNCGEKTLEEIRRWLDHGTNGPDS